MRPLKSVLTAFASLGIFLPASAQTTAISATTTTRLLTLQECVQLTVQHNLGLQMARIDPRVSLFNLEADYSSFDPNLTARINYTERTSPGGIITGSSVPLPPAQADTHHSTIALHGRPP